MTKEERTISAQLCFFIPWVQKTVLFIYKYHIPLVFRLSPVGGNFLKACSLKKKALFVLLNWEHLKGKTSSQKIFAKIMKRKLP